MTKRVHLQLLRQQYPACAETLIAKLGKEKQGQTWVFEDWEGAEFKKVAARCAKPIPLTAKRVIHGAAGLAKAVLKIDRTPADKLEKRKSICGTCPHLETFMGGKIKKCGLCGCQWNAKLLNASESCPLDPPRWGPVASE